MKPLGEGEVLLWDTNGTYKLRVNCNGESLSKLPCGTLVELTGSISPKGLCVDNIEVLHSPLNEEVACIQDLPDNPMDYVSRYYLYVRHPKLARSVKTYFYVVDYMRRYLVKHGFIELPSVIVGYASDPGLRGASKISVDLYGKRLELQSSMIMYKQLYASVFDKVFYAARNLRLEPPENAHTGRHLTEFTQIDVECANVKRDDATKLAESIIYRSVKWILSNHIEILDGREAERVEREISKPPYPRLTYEEALLKVKALGLEARYGEELSFRAEVAVADSYGSPVWIESFPVESRGFYYLEDATRPGHNIDYNLLMPSGHGEVLDGGCREYRYEYLYKRIVDRHKENPTKYEWFLELAKAGLIRPTCGWGIGVERLVKYLQGLKHIAYATPHPRIPGLIGP
ncbi:MAG: asparagine synthetase A [Desulfurococcaceae archaeon]